MCSTVVLPTRTPVQLAVLKGGQTKSKGKSGDVLQATSRLSSDGTTHIVHLRGTSQKNRDARCRRLVLSQNQARPWPGMCLANTKHTPYYCGAQNVLLMSSHHSVAEHGGRVKARLRAELVVMLSQNRWTHNIYCECSRSVSESPHSACYPNRM